ncbi:hypothetical protein [Thermoanaerobacterium sp. RBIITD]|uniref:hypothetical protein n=1 Tax=Thermoanaerobacterium sp. RBIITD TaxID=1550240 RepID=UPI000BB7193D|nr:hypothetical protein [Thermoanaerobacterium sp. RBIITD]SNX52895.1 hypothetical protein SAMN05660242_0355 [Thermoanaerobacterium sp. RBIITD]
MSNSVLIIGAGVEKTEGLNMPLANELIPELVKFTENQGKQISECLRGKLPNMRFSFRSLIKDGIESILYSDVDGNDKLAKKLKELSINRETLRIKLLYNISTKLSNIKRGNYIDEETIEIIRELFTEEELIDITDNNLLDLKYFTFTDAFKKMLVRLLEESIGLKTKSNDSNDEMLYNLLINEFLDFEKLLVDTFIGFYTKKKSDIKKYIYISWILWSYLSWKELTIDININEIPFYSKIPKKWNVITFNYTSFLKKCHENSIYFHGSCDEYIRLDNRNTLPIEQSQFKDIDDILDFLEQNINFDFEKEIYFIPSIIPPLKLKPVISTQFLDKWYKGKTIINKSDRIIIVGYSFSSADEHINDILRENKNKQVIIVNPSFKRIIPSIENIYRVNEYNFTEFNLSGKRALKADNIIIIDAYANEIYLSELELIG